MRRIIFIALLCVLPVAYAQETPGRCEKIAGTDSRTCLRRIRSKSLRDGASVSPGFFQILSQLPAAHVRNFGKVNEHVYRGGEPTLVGLQELGAMGVKVDIDLREAGEATSVEEAAAKKLGMKYVNIPFPPLSAPSNVLMERVLSLLTSNENDPVFLHCRRGKDRTGTVIACYRVQHDGWDNRRALAEAKQYGMSPAEHGMRSYIIHFTPPSPTGVVSPVQ